MLRIHYIFDYKRNWDFFSKKKPSSIRVESRKGKSMMRKLADDEIVIQPKTINKQYWKDLYKYRELLYFLAWRDIKVRYKQTIIGVAWAVIRPVLIMFVFNFIFSKLAGLPSEEGVPYPIMVYAALLPWNFFSCSLVESSNSLIGNVNLITKVYMPRLLIPASSVLVNLVDLLISFVVLGVLLIYFRFAPEWKIITLPFFVFIALLTAYGFSLWFCALSVRYRDFRYIVPFIVQFGLYISPVGFSSKIIPDRLRMLYSLNPMVGVIDGFRWAILGGDIQIYWPGFCLSLFFILIVFFGGLLHFRKTERFFADSI